MPRLNLKKKFLDNFFTICIRKTCCSSECEQTGGSVVRVIAAFPCGKTCRTSESEQAGGSVVRVIAAFPFRKTCCTSESEVLRTQNSAWISVNCSHQLPEINWCGWTF